MWIFISIQKRPAFRLLTLLFLTLTARTGNKKQIFMPLNVLSEHKQMVLFIFNVLMLWYSARNKTEDFPRLRWQDIPCVLQITQIDQNKESITVGRDIHHCVNNLQAVQTITVIGKAFSHVEITHLCRSESNDFTSIFSYHFVDVWICWNEFVCVFL